MTCLPGILCAPRAPWLLNPGLFPEGKAGEFPPSFPSLQSHPQGILGKPPAWIHSRQLWGDCGKWRSTRTRKAHTGPQNGELSLSLLLSPAHQGFRFQKAICALTAVPPLPLPHSTWFPVETVGPWLFWKISDRSENYPLLPTVFLHLFFFFFWAQYVWPSHSIPQRYFKQHLNSVK